MTDVHDKPTRSFNMSRIKCKNTKPELLVRKFLFSNGYRYRLYVKDLPGRPDIVLPKFKSVVFIHGCFWHGHQNCSQFKQPATNAHFWKEKIESNIVRDKKVTQNLENLGWKVRIIWTCEIKKNSTERLNELIDEIGK